MVYCGKPSAGCAECRKKKTRCDKATPSCGQCVRANRICPGYRSQLDLMFRSENAVVVGKANARGSSSKSHRKSSSPPPAPSPAPSSASSSSSTSCDEPFNAVALRNQCIGDSNLLFHEKEPSDDFQFYSLEPNLYLPSIRPTLAERALGYFNTHSSKWLRVHELVDTLCQTGDKPLLASISAVGLAGYANSVPGTELSNQARLDYVKALQLTNAALRSPTEVCKDSTLASVFILSVFEIVAGCTERSFEAWTEHINGATALLKLRGPGQFQTRIGQQLFVTVTSNLIVSCVQRTIPVPKHIIELRALAAKTMDLSMMPGWKFLDVIFDFANYRAAVRDCEIVGPRAIIEAGLEADRKFLAAFDNIPDSWKYRIVNTDQDDETVWNRRYDIYNDYWSAQIWNGMRSCRILIHEIIRDQLLAASTAMTPIFTEQESKEQNTQSVYTMLQMQADILASIPGHVPSSIRGKPASVIEGSRGYFVLWPLYMAGVMDLATRPIKIWVIGRLRAIAEQVGIRQARVLADVLETHRHIAAWDTKPAPRLRRDGSFFGWTPASGVGSIRPDWWDVDPPQAVPVPMSWD